MGYFIQLVEAPFNVDEEDKEDALAAIKQLMRDPEAERHGGASQKTDVPVEDFDDLPDDHLFEGEYGTYTKAEIEVLADVELRTESPITGRQYSHVELAELHFSGMNAVEPENWETLEEAMADWSYPVETDEEGNVVGLDPVRHKAGDEAQMFDAIAPYVGNASYLKFESEYGNSHRVSFHEDHVTSTL